MLALTQRRNPANSAPVIATRQRRAPRGVKSSAAVNTIPGSPAPGPSNGEVEGPADHVSQARRARNFDWAPPRLTTSASRTAPTMVRRRHQRNPARACMPGASNEGTYPSFVRSLISFCNVPTKSLSAWRLLTVKLRGRPRRQAALRSNEARQASPKRPEGRRGRTLSPGARGAKPQAPHGPLQRLLEGLVRGSIEGT